MLFLFGTAALTLTLTRANMPHASLPFMQPVPDSYSHSHSMASGVHPDERVGVIGVGVVGGAMVAHQLSRGDAVAVYDRSSEAVFRCASACPVAWLGRLTTTESVHELLHHARRALLLTLPTACPVSADAYDLQPLRSTLDAIRDSYSARLGAHARVASPVFVCSTVAPGTTDTLQREYPTLRLFHLPEFLSAQTAATDLTQPTHPAVLLGVPDGTPAAATERARVVCTEVFAARTQRVDAVRARESECTKAFCNAFYAAKVQLFNELYQLSARAGVSYATVQRLMLQQGWVHPMHTDVPGADGQLGFGGHCLPKDLRAMVRWGQLRGPTSVLASALHAHETLPRDGPPTTTDAGTDAATDAGTDAATDAATDAGTDQ